MWNRGLSIHQVDKYPQSMALAIDWKESESAYSANVFILWGKY